MAWLMMKTRESRPPSSNGRQPRAPITGTTVADSAAIIDRSFAICPSSLATKDGLIALSRWAFFEEENLTLIFIKGPAI